MGLRMRKSFTICKGVKVNLGKSGVSLSVGTGGLRHTIHTSGRSTSTIGISGTGISYSSSSGGKSKRQYSSTANMNQQNLKAQRQQQKVNERENNLLLINEHDNLIERVKSIHQECDTFIDWIQIKKNEPPFNPQEIGSNQKIAMNSLESFVPSFSERFIKSLASKKIQALEQEVHVAKIKDDEIYANWESLHNLSKKIISGDLDAYFQVISEMNPLDDLLEFGSDFEFGAETSDSLSVEFKVKSETTVPKYSMTLTSTGNISKKNLTKTAYYNLFQDYVCSCALRIARDMFSLLPVKTVIVHAVDSIIDSSTGHVEEHTILSIAFNKAIIQTLNFQMIDPSDSMSNFQHNMKFLKTAGFKPVQRIDD